MIDGRDHPGLKRESGHIGFLGHGSLVEFRNVRIKEIPWGFARPMGAAIERNSVSGREDRAPAAERR